MEAELAALDTATVEAKWLRELLMDLPVVEKPIPAIHMNCNNPVPRLAGARLPLAVTFILTDRYKNSTDREGVADSGSRTRSYKRSPAASLQIIPVSLSPLFIAEPLFSSLRPDRRGASAIRRAGLRTLRLLDPAPGEGE
jgi:hypothetical protein